jgi:hypothetical protein
MSNASSGRPKGSTKQNTMKLYSFNCPPELMDEIEAIARAEMTSSAAQIRRALKILTAAYHQPDEHHDATKGKAND